MAKPDFAANVSESFFSPSPALPESIRIESAADIVELPSSSLIPMRMHPYKVLDDPAMQALADSIAENGVLTPLLVRPFEGMPGKYEIVSGHRRKHAADIASVTRLPCIIRSLGDDDAIITMVESNRQRPKVLPSEKARALKMLYEANRRKAGRPCAENYVQLGHNYLTNTARCETAEQSDMSATQVQRYLHLAELSSDLLDMVDNRTLKMTPAVTISCLTKDEQMLLTTFITREKKYPTLNQAEQIKQLHVDGEVSDENIAAILTKQQNPVPSHYEESVSRRCCRLITQQRKRKRCCCNYSQAGGKTIVRV